MSETMDITLDAGVQATAAEQLTASAPAPQRRPVELSGDLYEDVEQIRQTLRADNQGQPSVFVTGGELTRLGRGDKGQPLIKRHTSMTFSHWIAERTRWVKVNRRGTSACNPPLSAVTAVREMADSLDEVNGLERVVQVPFFTRERRLADAEGYHKSSRVWYQASPRFAVPRVSEDPSASQVEAAKELILNHLLVDFPFASQADRAGAVAMLLEPFARDVIQGNTPLHLIEAATQGTGKSKLAQNCMAVALGCKPDDVPMQALSHDEAEIQKGITTDLMTGTPVVIYDNVSHHVKSPALAQALTSGTWAKRQLGGHDKAEFEIRFSWVMTSNNAAYDKDTARRLSLIRLDLTKLDGVEASVCENPETRDGFKHSNLEGWVMDHQGRLVWACLTLIQAWITAGGKAWSGKPLGSFESWSMVMGGVLEAAGIDGFLANRHQIEASGGDDRESILAFLQAWNTAHQGVDVTPADLAELNQSQENPLDHKPDKSGSLSGPMGFWLRKNKDRVVGGYQVIQSSSNKRKWRLHHI
ncbi:hypothetical protein ABZX95_06280 [Streptomyces sp. NPDC004232]|uniref:hypothetical protein n=1 Tax=Streptomyces sp. NPDC004232 TaxID=3154454 RepID=UPI0033BADB44